uniref:Rab-GAP TBC domain-containing protein n=1 Tax=Rhodosorus marinus TaxID=101924 RepID=A0A7S0BTG1_9RHOD|mmetsp:Transcript_8601/g.12611  ORF Transcript_8601/g.12611 Transcript_8601/m.12611 type:complete len:198 (+) Transcript_8601:2-595(+)
MFAAFMDQFRFKGVYADGLPVMYELVEKIISLGMEKVPAVMDKIASEGVPLDSFLPVWVMTGFTYYFPPTLAFKIWDILLVEGTTDMFVCSALAVLALSEAIIMPGNMEQITLWFQNGFAERKTGIVDNPERFLKIALEFENVAKIEEDHEGPTCGMFFKLHPLHGVRRLPRRTFEFVYRTGRRPFSKLAERRRNPN